jgi:hypothetical protein
MAIMKMIFRVLALASLAVIGQALHAQQLNIDPGTQLLTGISELQVNGVPYDVGFKDGSCVNLYDNCDVASDFTFQTEQSAIEAAKALLAAIQASPTYDNHPELTLGCSGQNFGASGLCGILTPHGVLPAPPFPPFPLVSTAAAYNVGQGFKDFIVIQNIGRELDLTNSLDLVYTIWKPSRPNTLPEGSTTALLGAGLWAWWWIRRQR